MLKADLISLLETKDKAINTAVHKAYEDHCEEAHPLIIKLLADAKLPEFKVLREIEIHAELPLNINVENIDDMDEDYDTLMDDADWYEIYQEEGHTYKNAFLTEKACKEHIQANNYHYSKPIDYLSLAFRNPELEKVMQFICELSGEKIHK